jgi:TonB family protein
MWTYESGAKQHIRTPDTAAACGSFFNRWARLLDGLESAVITGSDTLVFEGMPTSCDLVRAEYSTLTMTMCVDRNRSLILRETVETKAVPNPSSPSFSQSKTTIVCSSIERDPVLPPDFFTSEPPAGSSPAPRVEPRPPLPPGVYRVGNGVTAPTSIFKVEPTFTEEARAARINGTVGLYLEVDPDGVPRNIRVTRPLDPSLDQNAIEAVSQWRFRPGMLDGNPVTVAAQVEVNFRLLQGPRPGAILP